jgi:hypothetical protein
MNILFTVPHSICRSTIRDCDTVALKACNYLKQYFPYANSIISNTYRYDMDLNRIESINSSFHTQYVKILKSFNNNGLLLDIHSFPNDSSLDTYNLDFYIIIENTNTRMINLFKIFDINFKYKILDGINNFIIEEANKYNIDSFIIEFNESLSNERLKFLCKNIANIINLYYHNVS